MGPLRDNRAHQGPVMAGRPRIPFLYGQERFILHAFTQLHYSQARIAEEVQAAIPRVRRFLIDQGVYRPRPPQRLPARAAQLQRAVAEYIEGERVTEICMRYKVNAAELYRELRRCNVPLRQANGTAAAAPTVLEGDTHDSTSATTSPANEAELLPT